MVRGRTRVAEPDAAEDNGLNLKALKEKKISDLALIGKNFNIEGAANMRKQELIFAILQAQTEQNGHIYGEGVLAFCARRITTTCRVPTISTFHLARFDVLICVPATLSRVTSVPPRKANGTLRF